MQNMSLARSLTPQAKAAEMWESSKRGQGLSGAKLVAYLTLLIDHRHDYGIRELAHTFPQWTAERDYFIDLWTKQRTAEQTKMASRRYRHSGRSRR